MNQSELRKETERLARLRRFTRQDVLKIILLLEWSVSGDSYHGVLDLKQELGFDRYEDPEGW
jgi:hypothetical protein